MSKKNKAARKYLEMVAQDAAPIDWEQHDKRFHNGHFDPKTMTCRLREESAKTDDADKLRTANEIEFLPYLYAHYGDELLDKSPMNPFEGMSPRLQFENAYRRVHGKPIRRDWQDNIQSVLREVPPKDLPTVSQIDDFIDRISRPQDRRDIDRNGLNSDCPLVVTARMKNIFPHYRERSPRASDGSLPKAQDRYIRKEYERIKQLTPESQMTHPVFKFLESAYESGEKQKAGYEYED